MRIALFAMLGGLMQCVSTGPAVPADSLQLVVALGATENSTVVELRAFERANADSPWGKAGPIRMASIGRNGMAVGRGLVAFDADGYPVKKEGDGRSPAGVFRISAPYGYGDGLANATPGSPVTEIADTWQCVEDADSPFYNQIIDTRGVPKAWKGAEVLRRPDGLYSRMLIIGHNGALGGDVEKGKGSCIFFHVARGPGKPTAGCTALAAADLDALIRWLRPSKMPVYVLAPRQVYDKLAADPERKLPIFH